MTDKKPPRPVPQSVVNSPEIGDRLREILKEEGRAPVLPGGPKPEPPVDTTGAYLSTLAMNRALVEAREKVPVMVELSPEAVRRALTVLGEPSRALWDRSLWPALPCDVEDVGP